jgi:hypothetical protein
MIHPLPAERDTKTALPLAGSLTASGVFIAAPRQPEIQQLKSRALNAKALRCLGKRRMIIQFHEDVFA